MTEHPPSTDRFSDFTVFEQRLPTFSFGAAFSVGWLTLKRNYWPLVGTGVAFMGIQSIAGLLQSWFDNVWFEERVIELAVGGDFTYSPGSLVSAAAYIFLSPALSAGFQYVGLGSVRWQSPGIGKLFASFSCYWLLVRANLILSLFWAAPLALLGAGVGSGYLIGSQQGSASEGSLIGALVMALPALSLWLWLYARLAYSYLLIIDPLSNVSSAREALRASWTVTHPIAWRLGAVIVVLQVVVFIGFVLCCFPGLLIGLPLSCVVVPATYEMVRCAARTESFTEEVAE